jgi:hypothetical protein
MIVYYLGSLNEKINIHDVSIVPIIKPVTFIDLNHFSDGQQIFEFDYLIIGDIRLINNPDELELLRDGDEFITNFYYQTNIEHIFAVNDKMGNDSLYKIVNFILNIDL